MRRMSILTLEERAEQAGADPAADDDPGAGAGGEGEGAARGCEQGEAPRLKGWLGRVQGWGRALKEQVTEQWWFSGLVLAAIVMAGVSTAIGSYSAALAATEGGSTALSVLAVVDASVFWLFFAELVLRLLAEAPLFHRFIYDRWNIFDMCVVILSFPGLIAASATSVVRVIRLLRVLKLVRVLPGLRRLVHSLANSLSSLAYIAGLILLLLYLWAVAGAVLLGENDPAHWQGVHVAALTLYARGLLGDDWGEVLDTSIYGCDSPRSVYGGLGQRSSDGFPAVCAHVVESPWSGTLLFLSWEVLGTFVCLNLLVGSIVQSVSDVDSSARENAGSSAVVEVLRCDDLEAADLLGTSDPYVVATSSHADGTSANELRFKTKVRFRTLCPRWANERFLFQPLEEVGDVVTLRVFDFDRIGADDPLGEAVLDFSLLPENQPLELVLPLAGVSTGTITVRVERQLSAQGLNLEQLSREDRMVALCKRAEALWDQVRWELSAAATSRQALRTRALRLQGQSLKRLSAMVAALVQAKRKVRRAAGPRRARGEAAGAGAAERDAPDVSVDRALDGWVRATAPTADGGVAVRWFRLDDRPASPAPQAAAASAAAASAAAASAPPPLDPSAAGGEAGASPPSARSLAASRSRHDGGGSGGGRPNTAVSGPSDAESLAYSGTAGQSAQGSPPDDPDALKLRGSMRRLIGDTGWFADLAGGDDDDDE
ncbi:hypothetical protein FNF29_05397 [Cafeteria roenbergensis]|uniref:C2 domain-containing protein n=1 Tax=Cafeteria roenbergensis TaxID=33653 RepID=A0A5A8CAL5_CAFRO|nr:hypothetical protein FNF29_05397 [Cafeteria roenbergensis]|eukprot:KAA0150156.1 hypothetical protein FNF29_05397 [Cafeteria roenbergensis]